MVKFEAVLHTEGSGYWSDAAAAVKTTKLTIPYIDDEDGEFGELRVYFDTASWDINKDGLIYTDRQFLKELREFLSTLGFAGNDVEYSEQGMQGDDFVSCDIGKEFIDSFNAVTND